MSPRGVGGRARSPWDLSPRGVGGRAEPPPPEPPSFLPAQAQALSPYTPASPPLPALWFQGGPGQGDAVGGDTGGGVSGRVRKWGRGGPGAGLRRAAGLGYAEAGDAGRRWSHEGASPASAGTMAEEEGDRPRGPARVQPPEVSGKKDRETRAAGGRGCPAGRSGTAARGAGGVRRH